MARKYFHAEHTAVAAAVQGEQRLRALAVYAVAVTQERATFSMIDATDIAAADVRRPQYRPAENRAGRVVHYSICTEL
jgi:hypothetical protein